MPNLLPTAVCLRHKGRTPGGASLPYLACDTSCKAQGPEQGEGAESTTLHKDREALSVGSGFVASRVHISLVVGTQRGHCAGMGRTNDQQREVRVAMLRIGVLMAGVMQNTPFMHPFGGSYVGFPGGPAYHLLFATSLWLTSRYTHPWGKEKSYSRSASTLIPSRPL